MTNREITTPIVAPTSAPPQDVLPAPPSIPKKNAKPAITAHPNSESELLFEGVYPVLEDCFGTTGFVFGTTGQGVAGADGRGAVGVTGRGATGADGRGGVGVTGRGATGADGRGGVGVTGRGVTGADGREAAFLFLHHCSICCLRVSGELTSFSKSFLISYKSAKV